MNRPHIQAHIAYTYTMICYKLVQLLLFNMFVILAKGWGGHAFILLSYGITYDLSRPLVVNPHFIKVPSDSTSR